MALEWRCDKCNRRRAVGNAYSRELPSYWLSIHMHATADTLLCPKCIIDVSKALNKVRQAMRLAVAEEKRNG